MGAAGGARRRATTTGGTWRRCAARSTRRTSAWRKWIPQAFERMKRDLEKSHREAEQRPTRCCRAVSEHHSKGRRVFAQCRRAKAHQNAWTISRTSPACPVADVDAVKKVLETGTARAEQRHENLHAYQAPVPAPSMAQSCCRTPYPGQAATSYWSKLRANVRLGKAGSGGPRRAAEAARPLDKRLESDNDPHLQRLDEELRKTEQAAIATPTKRAALEVISV